MDPDVISDVQLAIFRMAADGLTDAEISQQTHLSPNTVKAHVSRAGKKLGATTRTHAVAILFNAGLLSLNGAFDPASVLVKVRVERDQARAEVADLRRQLREVQRNERERRQQILAAVKVAS